MRRITNFASLAIALPLALPLVGGGTAWADGSANANLRPVPVNGSDGSGTAMVTVQGNEIEFSLAASGLVKGPHVAHIHFGKEARHECPTAGEETDGDGRISTTEGGPAYGPVRVALTKTGDTSPKSGLAVDRFESGTSIQYMRGGVTVPADVANAVEQGQAVVVVHGVEYSGARAKAKSDLNPDLLASATDPAICGVLSAAPSGGAATGAGGSAATRDAGLLGLGGAALIAAAGAGTVLARRARS